ncbi:MAG: hypothetical protein HY253_06505 [Burkholderiales bacterium]|nr:hypothetical protein [Burkholderiales bacterium]
MATKNNKATQVTSQAKKTAPADASPNVAQPEGKGSLAQNDNPDLTQEQNATSSDATSAKRESIAGLEVQSKQAGFRRAGRAWPSEATFVALAELTDEQIAALEAEPLLIVKRVEG